MGSNGTVVSRGTDIATAISRNSKLVSEMEAAKQPSILKDAESDKERTSSNGIPEGKLIVTEEIQQGHVTWKAMKLFLASAAGDHPIMFFLAFLFGLLLCDLGIMSQTYFLGYWGSQYTERDPAEIDPFLYVVCFLSAQKPRTQYLPSYLGSYCLILSAVIFAYTCSNLLYLRGVVRASVTIHKRLVNAILGTTFRYAPPFFLS